MYAGNDLQAVQLLSGGGYVAVSSNGGTWTQQNSSSSSGRSGKGARGGSASKGVAVTAPTNTPIAPVGRQMAYIDATTGKVVAQTSGSQTLSRPQQPQQPQQPGRPGQQVVNCAGQAPTVMQMHSFQQPNGQQSASQPAAQQLLQVHTAPAGAQVYKLTNGTRVVKAGQPYPNTTIVQTAVAVPTGTQQPQPQAQSQAQQQPQQMGFITIRPPQQQQQLPPQQQSGQLQPQQPQQQLGQPQMQGLQLQLGSALQIAASAGSVQLQQQPQQSQPQQQLQQQQLQQQQLQQQLQQQQMQQAKVAILQPAPQQPQTHVLVAQPQTQIIQHAAQPLSQQQQQQAQQQLQGKRQQRQAAAPGPFQAVTVRSAGAPGGQATTIRPLNGGPITLTTIYTPPPTVTTVVRPAVRIPKLGTVATYNPVTGVRSAATSTGAPGGATLPLLPANLPASLVQQVHKANMLQQQQQQQHSANAAGAAALSGGLKAVLLQPQLQGQVVRPVGSINTVVTTTASATSAAGGGIGPHQRQTTVVVGGAGGMPGGVQSQPTQMGIAVVGGSLQQLQPHVQQMQAGMQQVVQTSPHLHVVTTAGGHQQQQLQQVHITLADGTTATTIMDQGTLSRMLSDASRGPQAGKLLQSRQLQQAAAGGSGQVQVQLQAMPMMQQQQHGVVQTSGQQLASAGLLNVLGGVGGGGGNISGNACVGKGPGGGGGSGGLEHLTGGLQTIHLPGATAVPTGATNGPAQVLIRSASQMSAGSAGSNSSQQQAPGMQQMANLRSVHILGPSSSQGNLQSQQQKQQQVDLMAGAVQQQQQQLLQLQQHQHSLEQQQHQQQQQFLQLQQQMTLGRRVSGAGMHGEGEALLDSSAMALAQLQVFSTQQRLQQAQSQQMQSQQQLSSVLEGLSVVDLDADHQQQQRLQQQQQVLSAMHQQRSQSGMSAGGAGGLLNMNNSGRLDSGGGFGTVGGLMLPEDAAAAAAMAVAASMAPNGGGDSAGAAASQAGAFGLVPGAGGDAGDLAGGSKEDLKAILVSIGQELARHGISVETAVTSGWLGVLTAMDVAVLADAYTEERRLLMQQQGSQGSASQQPLQQQQQQHAQSALTSQSSSQSSQQHQQHAAESGGALGNGEIRSGSNGDRASAGTAGLPALTSSSARTSMSVAPSEDGASTASGGGGATADLGAAGATDSNGAGSGGLYDLSKFNSFQYGFLDGGMLSSLGGGGGDFGSDLEKFSAGKPEAYRNTDAAAMADVFGDKPWPPFGMPVMAEEVGLSTQSHLQGYRHHFPPPHAVSLLSGSGGSKSGGNGSGSGTGPKLIDSASEYEARMPGMQGGQRQPLLNHHCGGGGGGGGRFPTAELGGSNPLQLGSGACNLHTAMSAPSGSVGGVAGAKGYSSAPSGVLGPAAGSNGCSAEDMGKEIENRFANLDLGCGFY